MHLLVESKKDWKQTVLYIPEISISSPRVRGPREDLYEVPLPELGSLIRLNRKLFTAGSTLSLRLVGLSESDFLKGVLTMYGVVRLTPKARQYLVMAEEAHYGADMRVLELNDEERKHERAASQHGDVVRS